MREDIIKSKLKLIEENIDLVEHNLPKKFENFENLGLVKDGIYKRIEASIQEVIDICSIINADLKLGIPSNRTEIMEALISNGILSKEMGNKLKKLKAFRNFLVPRYGQIDDKIAFKNIRKGLSDFQKFRKIILKFLEENT
jgi:uncharacterized protein YutE (UPF0331/DUF86 family)